MLTAHLLGSMVLWESARGLRLRPACTDSARTSPARRTPLLLYVHIPFCEHLCSFCSFHRVPYDTPVCERYFTALRRELQGLRACGFDFPAVYFGGGTPTVHMAALTDTIAAVRDLFSVTEVSVETNLDHLTRERLDALREANVNRLSVGVQSFSERLVSRLGRRALQGGREEAERRLRGAAGLFDTLNIDMIFNVPSQTVDELLDDADTILRLGAQQATFYPLMPPSPGLAACIAGIGGWRREKQYYELLADRLSPRMHRATTWCFSSGSSLIDEYIVNHDQYVGAGSGAFSYVGGAVSVNTFSIDSYIGRMGRGLSPVAFTRKFSRKQHMRYDLLMRLFSGELDLRRAGEKYDGAFARAMSKELLFLRTAGAVRIVDGRAELTRKGRYCWLVMMQSFFMSVGDCRARCRRSTADACRRAG